MKKPKYTGKGIITKVSKKSINYYKPLTYKDLEKFLKGINRHKLRDEKGRFKKKLINIVLASGYYTNGKVIKL